MLKRTPHGEATWLLSLARASRWMNSRIILAPSAMKSSPASGGVTRGSTRAARNPLNLHPRHRPDICQDENLDLQHQQCQPTPAESAAVASGRETGCRNAAGTEIS